MVKFGFPDLNAIRECQPLVQLHLNGLDDAGFHFVLLYHIPPFRFSYCSVSGFAFCCQRKKLNTPSRSGRRFDVRVFSSGRSRTFVVTV